MARSRLLLASLLVLACISAVAIFGAIVSAFVAAFYTPQYAQRPCFVYATHCSPCAQPNMCFVRRYWATDDANLVDELAAWNSSTPFPDQERLCQVPDSEFDNSTACETMLLSLNLSSCACGSELNMRKARAALRLVWVFFVICAATSFGTILLEHVEQRLHRKVRVDMEDLQATEPPVGDQALGLSDLPTCIREADDTQSCGN